MKQIKLDEGLLNRIDTGKNPRYNSKTKYISEGMDISKLMQSISAGWRIDSQIYIRRYKNSDNYYVIEGNRRISSLKKYYDNNYELPMKEKINDDILKLVKKEELIKTLDAIQIYEVENKKEEYDIVTRYHYSDDLKKDHNTLNNRFHMERKYFLNKEQNPYNQKEYDDLALFYYFSEIEELKSKDYKEYVKNPTPIPRTLFQNPINGKENNIKSIFLITNKEGEEKLEFNIGRYKEDFKDLFILLLKEYTKGNWINSNNTTIDDFYEKLTPKLRELIYPQDCKNLYRPNDQKVVEALRDFKNKENLLDEVLMDLEVKIKNNSAIDDLEKEKQLNDTSLIMILKEYKSFYNSYKHIKLNPISAHLLCRTSIENFWFNYQINDKVLTPKFCIEEKINKSSRDLKKFKKNENYGRLPIDAGQISYTISKINENKHIWCKDIKKSGNTITYIKETLKKEDVDKLSTFTHYPKESSDITDKIPNIINLHLELYIFFNSKSYQTSLISF